MGHNDETQTHSKSVAKHEHVERRGAIWYHRRRIPGDLVEARAYGRRREIKGSLKTTDLRTANARATTRDAILDAEFEQKRRELGARSKSEPTAKTSRERPLSSLAEIERKELVLHWFVREEQNAGRTRRKFYEADADPEIAEQRSHLIDVTIDELTALGSFQGTNFWEQSFKIWLKEQGVKFEPGEAAEELENWLRRARVETATRTLHALQRKSPREIDELFAGVTSGSKHLLSASSTLRMTLGELCDKFLEHKVTTEAKKATLKSYDFPIQVLNDLFSSSRLIASFTYSDGERLIEFLAKVPVYADKHYPGQTLVQAAKEESKTPRHGVLSPKRQCDVFTTIKGIFAYAAGIEELPKNPFGAKALADRLPTVGKAEVAQMSGEELTRLLSSPAFLKERTRTGHLNEPQQGRFWVVLLLLLHGLRANEAAQLLVSDVKEENDIAYLDVTETDDEGNIVKNLKTEVSKRRVPLHAELIKIGFLEFVKTQRSRDANGRLFHQFKPNNIDNYAASLSKWFSRLRDKTFGKQKRKGSRSLHSMRHGVTDAVRRITTSDEIRYALCGHSDGENRNSGSDYGKGYPLRTLKELVDKIEFDGLNLAFLYPQHSPCLAVSQ